MGAWQFKINPIFEALFKDNLDDKRYYQVYGGRGSGKSFAASIAIVLKTYSPYKHRILYLRQTMTSSEDSTIADVRAAIEALGLQRDFKEIKGVITNRKTKSTISFKGIRSSGSATAKLKSLSGITILVVEESEEIESFEEFSKIDESIRILGKPLKVILLYNPTSSVSSWIHKEWFHQGVPRMDRQDDTEYLHSTYLDNLKNLNPSVIKRYMDLAKTNPTYYLQTILAEWTLEVDSRIYEGWGMIPTFDSEDYDTWYGLDFGYGGKDHTSCVKVTETASTYYVEQMFSEAKLTLSKTRLLLKKAKIPKSALIYCDSAMPLLKNEIRDGDGTSPGWEGIRDATKGNVEAGIKKIQDKKIVLVGDDKSRLYHAYMTFCRDKKGKLPHEPDELAALRYAINSKNVSNALSNKSNTVSTSRYTAR